MHLMKDEERERERESILEPAHPNPKSNHSAKRVRVRVPGRRQRRNYYYLGCNEFGVQSKSKVSVVAGGGSIASGKRRLKG